MKYIVFFLSIFLFACSSVKQETDATMFGGEETDQETVKSLISASYKVYYEEAAPKSVVKHKLYTDPCTVKIAKETTGSEWDKGYVINNLECSQLKGDWIATFVLFGPDMKALPAFIRPNKSTNTYHQLTPMKVYVDEQISEPIWVLVDLL